MTPLQTRKDSFYEELIPYVPEYGKELVREFYEKWIEHNEPITPITKLRFEKQKTWQLSARLRTWKRNNEKWYPTKKKDEVPVYNFEEYRKKISSSSQC